jgi:N-acyl-phosphatidylethanolamine-hydrolysing phospholipase D
MLIENKKRKHHFHLLSPIHLPTHRGDRLRRDEREITSTIRILAASFILLFVLLCGSGCSSLVSRFASRAVSQLSEPIQPVPHKVETPLRADIGLSILWVGHATVLIQIHDKIILTDPVFTKTVGLLAKRSVEPGIDAAAVTRLNVILISHLHFDHFSYGSLDMLPKQATLIVPPGAAEYTPDFGFVNTREATTGEAMEEDGLRITPVPVQHFGGRYGFDVLWGPARPWTGYVIQYKGTTVFFSGDTGYNPEFFKEIGRRFHIDVALLPIAPVEPREFMKHVHTDPAEALQAFEDLGATIMIPIHHDTFFQGLEPEIGYAKKLMQALIEERGLQDRVKLLVAGEQLVLKQ